MGTERGHPPQLPPRILPGEGSRALAAPLPPAEGWAGRPPVRPAGWAAAVTVFPLTALSVVVGGCWGWESGFPNPSSFTPSGESPPVPPARQGAGGQSSVTYFPRTKRAGGTDACRGDGVSFRSFLLARGFVQLLPRFAGEVTSR